MFGECVDAKLPISNKVKIPKGGSKWFVGVYIGKDTEADEVILGNANGVFKIRTVKKTSFSAMECGWSQQNVISAVAAQR